MKITNEMLRQKLAERDTRLVNLKQGEDWLTVSLRWIDQNPPPKIPRFCHECGAPCGHWQMDWDDVRQELEAGREIPDRMGGLCPKHSDKWDSDKDEDEDDPSDEEPDQD